MPNWSSGCTGRSQSYVNEHLKVIPHNLASPAEFAALFPADLVKVRDALNARLQLIESFAEENPAHLPADDLETVRSWRHLVAGTFCVFRELKNYTVFLPTGSSAASLHLNGCGTFKAVSTQ